MDATAAVDAPNEDAAKRAASDSSSSKQRSRRDHQPSSAQRQSKTASSSSPSADSAPHDPRSTASTSEVAASDEPAVLLHCRLGSVKLSAVVSGAQAAKVQRQLSSIITAKASDGLMGGGKGGGGEAEAERKKRERVRQTAAKRKRQRDERESRVTAGTASSGQVKRHKQELKRREGNRTAAHPTASSGSQSNDEEMKDAK